MIVICDQVLLFFNMRNDVLLICNQNIIHRRYDRIVPGRKHLTTWLVGYVGLEGRQMREEKPFN